MRAPVLWIVWIAALGACGDNTTATAPSCVPECRAGFTCVSGSCVSACNPPCGRNERCSGSGAAAVCVSTLGDAGDDLGNDAPAADATPQTDGAADDASDASTATDAPADGPGDGSAGDATADDVPRRTDGVVSDGEGMDAADATVVTDVPAVMDVPRMDVVADAARTDAGLDAVAPTHCGNPGEICCVDVSCIPGAECIDNRCVPLSRAAAECDHPGVCPTGYACLGPQFCGDRTCFQCGVSRGTVAFGGDCTGGMQCASGVCDRGRCTTACTIGSTGDSECNARSAGWTCTQRIYGVGQRDGSIDPVGYVTLGTCAQSCGRNADCTAGRACLPTTNFLTDRINFICGITTRTGVAGTACDRPEQCQSGLCIPGVLPDAGSGCTAPCVSNSDCPPSAPVCERLTLITPAGSFQTTRGCLPSM